MKATHTNRAGSIKESKIYDRCQTPGYALDALLPYLRPEWRIWESACGDGQLVRKLSLVGFDVVATDILSGYNFFEYEPTTWDIQATNPPFSIKYKWLQRSYALQKPFALLLPVATLGAAGCQRLIKQYGVETILLDKRVNFKMPHKGYSGKGADFPVYWHTWGLSIGQQITCASINVYPDEQLVLFPNVVQLPEVATHPAYSPLDAV